MASRFFLVMSFWLLAFPAFGVQASSDAEAASTKFDEWWDGLASRDLEVMTEAILKFSNNSPGTIDYLGSRVVSLTLDEESFEQLLKELHSEDKDVAEAANYKLRYRDPRLLMTVSELMEKFPACKDEVRFAEVLMDYDYGKLGDAEVEYMYSETADGSVSSGIRRGNGTTWVSPNLDLLCELGGKKSWQRAVCVIKILEHIGTPEAQRLIARLGQGHPGCMPTQVARKIGLKLKSEKNESGEE